MRDRITISLNPLLTTRLTRLSKRKPCASCVCVLGPYRTLPGKKSRIVFANVNILFTSGRVKNRFTTGSRDSKGCERDPEFGVLFTFLYLMLYLYLGSFFTKCRNNRDKNGINRSKSAFCSRSCSELSLLRQVFCVEAGNTANLWALNCVSPTVVYYQGFRGVKQIRGEIFR